MYANDQPVSLTDPTGRESQPAPGPDAEFNVGECVSGVLGFAYLAEAGTLLMVGGLALGGTGTAFGVSTGGLGAPVTAASLAGTVLLEGIGVAAEVSAFGLIYKTCVSQ